MDPLHRPPTASLITDNNNIREKVPANEYFLSVVSGSIVIAISLQKIHHFQNEQDPKTLDSDYSGCDNWRVDGQIDTAIHKEELYAPCILYRTKGYYSGM